MTAVAIRIVRARSDCRSRDGSLRWSSPGNTACILWAHPLRLDCTRCKKRFCGVMVAPNRATAPTFVELIASHPAMVSECVIEFESSIGGKMRIQWKGSAEAIWITAPLPLS
jgi:hypothetical protein